MNNLRYMRSVIYETVSPPPSWDISKPLTAKEANHLINWFADYISQNYNEKYFVRLHSIPYKDKIYDLAFPIIIFTTRDHELYEGLKLRCHISLDFNRAVFYHNGRPTKKLRYGDLLTSTQENIDEEADKTFEILISKLNQELDSDSNLRLFLNLPGKREGILWVATVNRSVDNLELYRKTLKDKNSSSTILYTINEFDQIISDMMEKLNYESYLVGLDIRPANFKGSTRIKFSAQISESMKNLSPKEFLESLFNKNPFKKFSHMVEIIGGELEVNSEENQANFNFYIPTIGLKTLQFSSGSL